MSRSRMRSGWRKGKAAVWSGKDAARSPPSPPAAASRSALPGVPPGGRGGAGVRRLRAQDAAVSYGPRPRQTKTCSLPQSSQPAPLHSHSDHAHPQRRRPSPACRPCAPASRWWRRCRASWRRGAAAGPRCWATPCLLCCHPARRAPWMPAGCRARQTPASAPRCRLAQPRAWRRPPPCRRGCPSCCSPPACGPCCPWGGRHRRRHRWPHPPGTHPR